MRDHHKFSTAQGPRIVNLPFVFVAQPLGKTATRLTMMGGVQVDVLTTFDEVAELLGVREERPPVKLEQILASAATAERAAALPTTIELPNVPVTAAERVAAQDAPAPFVSNPSSTERVDSAKKSRR